MAGVPVVAERVRTVVRFDRADLPSGSGVLRVLAPVVAVPAGVAVLVARRRDPDRRDRALRVGRHPAASAGVRRQGGAGRAGAPVGVAGPDLPGEGVGLLHRPVRPADVAARRRRGSVLHRRQGATARAQLPGDRGGDLRDPVPGQHPRAPVEPAGDRRGRPRAGVGPARHGVSGVRAAVQRQAAGAAARNARTSSTTSRARVRAFQLDTIDVSERPADPGRDGRRAGGERSHGLQHPAVASERAEGELPVPATDPSVLRVRRRGRRPVRPERNASRPDGLGPRGDAERDPHGRQDLAEHAPGLHARVRRGGRAGEHRVERGRAGAHAPRHPAGRRAHDRAAADLLRRAERRPVRRDQHRREGAGLRGRLPGAGHGLLRHRRHPHGQLPAAGVVRVAVQGHQPLDLEPDPSGQPDHDLPSTSRSACRSPRRS